MAVIRQFNFLSEARIDVPDLRSLESAVANDFDLLAGRMLAGESPLVVKGFTIGTTSTLGASADLLELDVASGLLLHYGASEAGTIFNVPSDRDAELLAATNTKVTGAFVASNTNYVGLDLLRSADDDTSDSSKFIDADTSLEFTQTVPKARTLDYQIIISTQPFSISSNVAPIAKVVTDSSNNVVSVTDARNMLFRLGVGSDIPDGTSSYAWTDAGRSENTITYSSGSAADPFVGGDKGILSLKEWMDSVMTRLWEVGSGEFWYSPTARDNAKLLFGSDVIVATSDNFEWDTTPDTLEWQDLRVAFENSTGYYNEIQDGDALLDTNGQCLYVDLVRGSNATVVPAVAELTALGSPDIPGSRFIIAWRLNDEIYIRDRGTEVGRGGIVATTSILGVVTLNNTPASAGTPAVVSIMANGRAEVAASGGNSYAIKGTGNGTGAGLKGVGGATGPGGEFSPNSARGALNLISDTADPSAPSDGDIWYRYQIGVADNLKTKLNGGTWTFAGPASFGQVTSGWGTNWDDSASFPTGYILDHIKGVHLNGQVDVTSNNPANAIHSGFLPVGSRPATNKYFVVPILESTEQTNSFITLRVGSDGSLTLIELTAGGDTAAGGVIALTTGQRVVLDGVHFFIGS